MWLYMPAIRVDLNVAELSSYWLTKILLKCQLVVLNLAELSQALVELDKE